MLPWDEYSRTRRLPKGTAHAIGRDAVEEALNAAGAKVGSLTFYPGDTFPKIFDVVWLGDSSGGYFRSGPPREPYKSLMMRWNAVPSASRASLAAEITELWLPKACAWAAAAPGRGNVWTATEHSWMLVDEDGRRKAVET